MQGNDNRETERQGQGRIRIVNPLLDLLDLCNGHRDLSLWAYCDGAIMIECDYEGVFNHLNHEIIIEMHDNGDISIGCADCGVTLVTWERPPEPLPWHGRQYFKETGAEPNIGDIMMEGGGNQ